MKNINNRDWYYFWWTTRETNIFIIITSCINYFIPMTTFALVHRQTTSGRTDNSTATPVTKEKDDKNIDVQRKRRSQKNASYVINGGYQKTRYTSQIGLIYLKPIVRYSTSVYFHSKSDFYEEPRSPKDNRYDSSCFRVNELWIHLIFFLAVASVCFLNNN